MYESSCGCVCVDVCVCSNESLEYRENGSRAFDIDCVE